MHKLIIKIAKNSDILNVVQIKPGINVQKDNSKDVLLTEFGKFLEKIDIYFLMRIIRVCSQGLLVTFQIMLKTQRLYDYMSKHWFMPSTPILSNGGTNRGLPISLFFK